MDAARAPGESAIRRRRSRVVLISRRRYQVGDDALHRAGDGDKKARSPGRARRKPLKPFAQGRPDEFGGPVVTTLVWFFHFHARLRVHRGARLSLRPPIFQGGYVQAKRAQKLRRDREAVAIVFSSEQDMTLSPDLAIVICRSGCGSGFAENPGTNELCQLLGPSRNSRG
jgi:hypothetical protein